MPNIDRIPDRHDPITVAADVARRGETTAAATIRDLVELARALDDMCAAYRVGGRNGRPSERVLDTINRHSWMIR